jgi:hypothetical protein
MINAAIVGLGWWGRLLVKSVQGISYVIQFKAGGARTISPRRFESMQTTRHR